MVMNMYGLTQSSSTWTNSDVEQHLDGNICRCTGYRPILDAFKSVAPTEIEDIGKAKKLCSRKGKCCKSKQKAISPLSNKEIIVDGVTWYQPTSLAELSTVLAGLSDGTTYRYVCGNTSVALYDGGPYSVYINTRMIPELYSRVIASDSLTFGVNKSVTDTIAEFETLYTNTNFSYLYQIAKHWKKIASTSVRNLGSVGGNLMLKNQMKGFPSDIFTTLLAAGATVGIATNAGTEVAYYDLQAMLSMDFASTKSVLVEFRLPSLSDAFVYRSYKVMPRNANSRAYVAAAFCIEFDTSTGHTVTGSPVLAFTGISSTFVRATETEAYLIGKDLEDQTVLQGALTTLAAEMVPDTPPEDPSDQYKIAVSQTLLYRYVLELVNSVVAPSYLSGSTELIRGTSSGEQIFDLNEDTWPLGKPIPKIEARIQCSGEAEYVKTMRPVDGQLIGLFLQSTKANARIASIDATNALNIPGVVSFISAADIPGQNNIIVYEDANYSEKLFPAVSDRVGYYGQPIGLIVASDRGAAYSGLYSIVVEYEDEQPPILTIADALAQGSTDTLPGMDFVFGDVDTGFSQSTNIITGSMTRDGQFHFHMETHSCLTVPKEDGFDVYSSTQWLAETQASIAQVLDLPDNDIYMTNRRCGGGFGAKIGRGNIAAAASALASYKTRKPVRVDLDLDVNMTMIGWRDPFLCEYKVRLKVLLSWKI
ncbi:putative aldehyde oxidase 1 [Armadillidium nasatum]|uniref:Putative aldehyde oxidase 1 n=1 Tax=Armadillidium nasatum TaxID=96803 RepID=A0A5N5TLR5_9CRUS|nr:putative aldehyde oxidase 1 [Armadillidium nasatum]